MSSSPTFQASNWLGTFASACTSRNMSNAFAIAQSVGSPDDVERPGGTSSSGYKCADTTCYSTVSNNNCLVASIVSQFITGSLSSPYSVSNTSN